jgi:hypothetical protein
MAGRGDAMRCDATDSLEAANVAPPAPPARIAMSAALIAALFFTVALLVTHGYFLLGSLPLLVLEHDIPMDARFVRGFLDTYYLAAMVTAGATALSCAFAGMPVFSAGAAALALVAFVLRRTVVPGMESLGARIQARETSAITSFRRLHLMAIAANLAQIVLVVWGLIAFSMQLRH